MLDAYDPPLSARKSPVQLLRMSIGPTPQKDGKVLGLFDLLSPASSAGRTPSKKARNSLSHGIGLSHLRTPSKRGVEDEGQKSGMLLEGKGLVISPTDASKRAHISSLLTPTARRILATPSKSTPTSRRALDPPSADETPAFLKRYSQPTCVLPDDASRGDGLEFDIQAISWTPVKPRPGPRTAGKRLSALVRGLREMEEEKLDEELDILRELEDGGNARPALKFNKVPEPFNVADSQIPEMPLGADGANLINTDGEDDYIEPEKPGRGRSEREGKPWKKKGQKRTTRKFTLRPVRAAWKPEPKWKVSSDTSEDEEPEDGEGEREEGEISTIAETQISHIAIAIPPDPSIMDDLLDDDKENRDNADTEAEAEAGFEPKPTRLPSLSSDDDTAAAAAAGRRKKAKIQKKGKEEAAGEDPHPQPQPQPQTRKSNPKKKPTKTNASASAYAHANFRALKLRNRNSRGQGRGRGAGGGRRFGRRR